MHKLKVILCFSSLLVAIIVHVYITNESAMKHLSIVQNRSSFKGLYMHTPHLHL